MSRRKLYLWATFIVIMLSPLLVLRLWLRQLEVAVEHTTPQNLLIITVDTLRADRVGAYGHDQAQTPVMDAFARAGLQLERTWAPIPITNPSHASLMTGLDPHTHGVLTNGVLLEDEAPVLAELFRQRGYRTAAFVSGFSLVGRISGLQRGFELYDDKWSSRKVERSASAAVSAASRWLAGLEDEKFFLWVHLFDPHSPYAPPYPFDRLYGPPPPATPTPSPETAKRFEQHRRAAADDAGFGLIQSEKMTTETTAEELANQLRLYDGEIAYTDRAIGDLLRALAHNQLLNDTLVVLTADHGEGFDHDYYYYHGDRLYESAVHVPFFIAGPEKFQLDGLRDGLLNLTDVVPTLSALFRFPQTTGDGQNQLAYLQGTMPPPRSHMMARAPKLNRAGLSQGPLAALTTADWKLILRQQTSAVEVYHLAQDPGELRDLTGTGAHPPRLLGTLSAWAALGETLAAPDLSHVDPEARENLERLGYVQ